MKSYDIVILPGDGIGPEVIEQGARILELIENAGICTFNIESIPCAGSYYIDHGEEWPEGSLERCKKADAILLGAIGHIGPDGKPGRRADGELAGYEQVIGMRMKLDLYANVRPITLYPGVKHLVSGEFVQVWRPENVNMLMLRENTEGAYTKGSFVMERGGVVESATTGIAITRKGAERITRRAFELAKSRNGAPSDGVTRVTCIEKSNVLHSHRLFRNVFREVAQDYPDVAQDFGYVDSFCHNLVRNPEYFDVVVAPNFPGDIITDLGSALQGGMGMSASGNIGDDHGMFEPVHGSAPDIAGQEKANPAATILSVGMMLEWIAKRQNDSKLEDTAKLVEQAVQDGLSSGAALTADLGGAVGTSSAGNVYVENLSERLRALS